MARAEHTPDGRFIVVDGRRWRATDPHIPERLRVELVAELMAARRALRDRAGGRPPRDAGARVRVQDAKVALGERGEPWWDESTAEGRDQRLAAAIRTLLRHRKPESSICPSDAARVAAGKAWRSALDDARRVAGRLREQGVVRVTQHGHEVDPAAARGPLRISRGPDWVE